MHKNDNDLLLKNYFKLANSNSDQLTKAKQWRTFCQISGGPLTSGGPRAPVFIIFEQKIFVLANIGGLIVPSPSKVLATVANYTKHTSPNSKGQYSKSKDTVLFKTERFGSLKTTVHTFSEVDHNLFLSVYFDLIECIMRCKIDSSERQSLCLLGNLNLLFSIVGGGFTGYST